MKIKSDYILRELAGSHVVVPMNQEVINLNGIISLNDAGMFLWKELLDDKSEQDLVCAFLEEYNVSQVTANKDINDFVTTLREADILE